ncbi:acyl CoA:acetate/3-ketoacid CoA transferase [Cereibacter azotoformans]|nr:CoA-transferase [Cereibacter azotoformans]ULB09736.1 acyl CoA:acetate/3-ketoacid CoA transferase [Cereibacter azotoformans]
MIAAGDQGDKVMPAERAVAMVRPGSTLGVGGAGGVQEPDLLIETLARRFRETGEPGRLTEFHAIRCGEIDGRGTSLFGAEGFVSRMYGGSFWPAGTPALVRQIHENRMAAWNFSIGVMYGLLEAAAAGRPGLLTEVGLDTFVDPLQSGGALNEAAAREPAVERVTVGGRPMLFYRTVPIDVAFIRGTTADPCGNVTMEEEPANCGALALAQAAKANGGRVIVQVKRLAPRGALDPHLVRVPGILVDAVVLSPGQRQTTHVEFDPTLVGAARLPLEAVPIPPMSADKVILRRALLEARPGETLAIGFGAPGFIPAIAVEEGVFDRVTFSVEHGVIGGINGYACGGRTFPCAHNPEAIIDAADQLRFFAGGGLDRAFLGVGEVDGQGNVNVSRFGDRIPGAGGFIDMTQGTRDVVFCIRLGDRGRRKFVPRVEQVTFSGPRALREGQNILYITEKAVFRLRPEGLVLTEIREGLDPRRDVLDLIGAEVRVASDLIPMPDICFRDAPMGLADLWTTEEKEKT